MREFGVEGSGVFASSWAAACVERRRPPRTAHEFTWFACFSSQSKQGCNQLKKTFNYRIERKRGHQSILKGSFRPRLKAAASKQIVGWLSILHFSS
jgi:hypothetical protein